MRDHAHDARVAGDGLVGDALKRLGLVGQAPQNRGLLADLAQEQSADDRKIGADGAHPPFVSRATSTGMPPPRSWRESSLTSR